MFVRESRVAVVGGSIAGCAAAVALARAGCAVTVFERSSGGLRDRGAGITIAASVHDELVAAGYLDSDMRSGRRPELIWVTRDGAARDGRIVGRQPYPAIMASWALVWRGLRNRIPDAAYHEGVSVTDVRCVADGVDLRLDTGQVRRFAAVVGADGYRSRIRPVVSPESEASHGGYGLWRGDFPAGRFTGSSRPVLVEDFVAVGFRGGHSVFYQIPDSEPGQLRQNWALYGPVPDWLFADGARPVPPGRVDDRTNDHLTDLVRTRLPPAWAETILLTERSELSINPIYDVAAARYVHRSVLLAGDAGAIARPHTGGGAVKAIQDAWQLERACLESETWEEALAVYDAQRCAAGNALTELGRHLGRMRVEESPDWPAMTDADFEAWLYANTHGWKSAYDPA
jgi:2-polyprenyl-6-methoxyphenol hydroxylase-like FAD-dependent oxidoreductase